MQCRPCVCLRPQPVQCSLALCLVSGLSECSVGLVSVSGLSQCNVGLALCLVSGLSECSVGRVSVSGLSECSAAHVCASLCVETLPQTLAHSGKTVRHACLCSDAFSVKHRQPGGSEVCDCNATTEVTRPQGCFARAGGETAVPLGYTHRLRCTLDALHRSSI